MDVYARGFHSRAMDSPRRASPKLARALRQTAPTAERQLWALLRDRRLDGLKFRRQVPLGRFVADFLCHRHRLVIEADGPFHNQARDEARDAWLAAQSYRVLRFTIQAVLTDRRRVLDDILRAVERPLDGQV